MKLAELFTVIKVRDSGFRNALGRIRGAIGRVGAGVRRLLGLFARIAVVGAAAFAGLAFLLGQQEKAERKLEAVLIATGHAAGFSAKALKARATELQKMTTFGDEAILTTQAMIATFKDIKGETFDEATKAILDMATVMDQDLRSTAIQVGKALNDPVKGATALRRVGVQLTQQQEELIKTLVASGDVMAAQGVILKELASEFGGAATAQVDTFWGSLVQVKNALGDLGQAFAKRLAPTMQQSNRQFLTIIEHITKMVEESQFLGKVISNISNFITSALRLVVFAYASAEVAVAEWRDVAVIAAVKIELAYLRLKDTIVRAFNAIAATTIRSVRPAIAVAREVISLLPALSGFSKELEAGFDKLDTTLDKLAAGFEQGVKRKKDPMQVLLERMLKTLEGNLGKRIRSRFEDLLITFGFKPLKRNQTPGGLGTATPDLKPTPYSQQAAASKIAQPTFAGVADLARKIQLAVAGGGIQDKQLDVQTRTLREAQKQTQTLSAIEEQIVQPVLS